MAGEEDDIIQHGFKSREMSIENIRALKTAVKEPKEEKPKRKGFIRKRTTKQAKKMRQLGKINKEILGDKARDLTEPCQIKSPVCTYYATVINHDAGRVGAALLDKDNMTPCCPPCNDYIESHPGFAGGRFKKRRHGQLQRGVNMEDVKPE